MSRLVAGNEHDPFAEVLAFVQADEGLRGVRELNLAVDGCALGDVICFQGKAG